MKEHNIDFKKGKVKGNPTICFVRSYWNEYDYNQKPGYPDWLSASLPSQSQEKETDREWH
jgi:hypothetical protein